MGLDGHTGEARAPEDFDSERPRTMVAHVDPEASDNYEQSRIPGGLGRSSDGLGRTTRIFPEGISVGWSRMTRMTRMGPGMDHVSSVAPPTHTRTRPPQRVGPDRVRPGHSSAGSLQSAP